MVQGPLCEANSSSVSQETPGILKEPESSTQINPVPPMLFLLHTL